MAVPARPVAGALLDDAWGIAVHDAIVVQDIQAGAFNAVHSANPVSAAVAVTFARAFATPPQVVFGCSNFNYSVGLNGSLPTVAGFTANTYRITGVAATATIPVQWVAYGPRA